MVELDKTNAVVLMQSMVSAMTRRTKRNKVVKFIIRKSNLLETAFDPRMIQMVNHQIIGRPAKPTSEFVSFENGLLITRKPSHFPSPIVSHLDRFQAALSSALVFSRSVGRKLIPQPLTPQSTVFGSHLAPSSRDTRVTKLLSGRTQFEDIATSNASLISVVFHNFRVSFCGGIS